MLYSVTVNPHSKKGPLVLPAAPATGSNATVATSTSRSASAASSSAVPSPATSPQSLTVYLREKPIDGEANTALIKLLADYFDLPKTQITIRSGAHSRQKLIEIPDA